MTTDSRSGQSAVQTEPHPSVEAVLARTMPWAVSLFFHVGLALVMMMVAMIAISRPPVARSEPPPIVVGAIEDPVFRLTEPRSAGRGTGDGTGDNFRGRAKGGEDFPELRRTWDRQIESLDMKTRDATELILRTDESPDQGRLRRVAKGGLWGVGGMDGPDGFGGNDPNPGGRSGRSGPCQVIFVIDRSGSMAENMDPLIQEMVRTISYLRNEESAGQRDSFHVIFFASGAPLENPPRRLVPATAGNKTDAVKFLETVLAEGQTDPVPALKRAFEVLQQADPRAGKVIYFLTDGVFPDDAPVLEAIRRMNAKKDVHIFTFLYGQRPAHAVEVMKRIASENHGNYKYVAVDQ